jgi:hypothetical protein
LIFGGGGGGGVRKYQKVENRRTRTM